ncbi:MAG: Uma2 family endonuclease [Lachnospiraceae bacterium]|nr:Uma2 family endonuclease [Lachnospiraceae bacterium]
MANYIDSKNSSCEVYPAPFAVKLFSEDDKNVVEPDISVICDPNKLTDRGCTGAPDWIVEIISPTTSSHDYVLFRSLSLKVPVFTNSSRVIL